ncbi:hypothetical protein CYK37_24710 [Mesorhizobium loti]|nr:hypothetical protein CYK37_24710 [Mesorhizobium loti]
MRNGLCLTIIQLWRFDMVKLHCRIGCFELENFAQPPGSYARKQDTSIAMATGLSRASKSVSL